MKQPSQVITALALGVVLWMAIPTYTQTASGIRLVDFRNFTYSPSCLNFEDNKNPEAITTVDGAYSRGDATDPSSDKVFFEVRDVIYGDLTGDGQEEALVTTNCDTGGTGQFSDGIIFRMRGGRPVPIASLGVGDRADGGIHAVSIEKGLLRVERYGQKDSGACCPEYIETTSVRLLGSQLVQVGKTSRRPYEEESEQAAGTKSHATPIHFAKGRTSAAIKGTTNGTVEYSIGARAGQTMLVHVASEKDAVGLTVLGRDGSPVEGKTRYNDWGGSLPYSGQYRIIVNASHGAAAYTLEVTIR
ncbi:MAG TPA: hypothetical protein VJX67_07640 [Blastocatellia bacterium]|nr:hypothetical protein [Blastocatellia bacterium]